MSKWSRFRNSKWFKPIIIGGSALVALVIIVAVLLATLLPGGEKSVAPSTEQTSGYVFVAPSSNIVYAGTKVSLGDAKLTFDGKNIPLTDDMIVIPASGIDEASGLSSTGYFKKTGDKTISVAYDNQIFTFGVKVKSNFATQVIVESNATVNIPELSNVNNVFTAMTFLVFCDGVQTTELCSAGDFEFVSAKSNGGVDAYDNNNGVITLKKTDTVGVYAQEIVVTFKYVGEVPVVGDLFGSTVVRVVDNNIDAIELKNNTTASTSLNNIVVYEADCVSDTKTRDLGEVVFRLLNGIGIAATRQNDDIATDISYFTDKIYLYTLSRNNTGKVVYSIAKESNGSPMLFSAHEKECVWIELKNGDNPANVFTPFGVSGNAGAVNAVATSGVSVPIGTAGLSWKVLAKCAYEGRGEDEYVEADGDVIGNQSVARLDFFEYIHDGNTYYVTKEDAMARIDDLTENISYWHNYGIVGEEEQAYLNSDKYYYDIYNNKFDTPNITTIVEYKNESNVVVFRNIEQYYIVLASNRYGNLVNGIQTYNVNGVVSAPTFVFKRATISTYGGTIEAELNVAKDRVVSMEIEQLPTNNWWSEYDTVFQTAHNGSALSSYFIGDTMGFAGAQVLLTFSSGDSYSVSSSSAGVFEKNINGLTVSFDIQFISGNGYKVSNDGNIVTPTSVLGDMTISAGFFGDGVGVYSFDNNIRASYNIDVYENDLATISFDDGWFVLAQNCNTTAIENMLINDNYSALTTLSRKNTISTDMLNFIRVDSFDDLSWKTDGSYIDGMFNLLYIFNNNNLNIGAGALAIEFALADGENVGQNKLTPRKNVVVLASGYTHVSGTNQMVNTNYFNGITLNAGTANEKVIADGEILAKGSDLVASGINLEKVDAVNGNAIIANSIKINGTVYSVPDALDYEFASVGTYVFEFYNGSVLVGYVVAEVEQLAISRVGYSASVADFQAQENLGYFFTKQTIDKNDLRGMKLNIAYNNGVSNQVVYESGILDNVSFVTGTSNTSSVVLGDYANSNYLISLTYQDETMQNPLLGALQVDLLESYAVDVGTVSFDEDCFVYVEGFPVRIVDGLIFSDVQYTGGRIEDSINFASAETKNFDYSVLTLVIDGTTYKIDDNGFLRNVATNKYLIASEGSLQITEIESNVYSSVSAAAGFGEKSSIENVAAVCHEYTLQHNPGTLILPTIAIVSQTGAENVGDASHLRSAISSIVYHSTDDVYYSNINLTGDKSYGSGAYKYVFVENQTISGSELFKSGMKVSLTFDDGGSSIVYICHPYLGIADVDRVVTGAGTGNLNVANSSVVLAGKNVSGIVIPFVRDFVVGVSIDAMPNDEYVMTGSIYGNNNFSNKLGERIVTLHYYAKASQTVETGYTFGATVTGNDTILVSGITGTATTVVRDIDNYFDAGVGASYNTATGIAHASITVSYVDDNAPYGASRTIESQAVDVALAGDYQKNLDTSVASRTAFYGTSVSNVNDNFKNVANSGTLKWIYASGKKLNEIVDATSIIGGGNGAKTNFVISSSHELKNISVSYVDEKNNARTTSLNVHVFGYTVASTVSVALEGQIGWGYKVYADSVVSCDDLIVKVNNGNVLKYTVVSGNGGVTTELTTSSALGNGDVLYIDYIVWKIDGNVLPTSLPGDQTIEILGEEYVKRSADSNGYVRLPDNILTEFEFVFTTKIVHEYSLNLITSGRVVANSIGAHLDDTAICLLTAPNTLATISIDSTELSDENYISDAKSVVIADAVAADIPVDDIAGAYYQSGTNESTGNATFVALQDYLTDTNKLSANLDKWVVGAVGANGNELVRDIPLSWIYDGWQIVTHDEKQFVRIGSDEYEIGKYSTAQHVVGGNTYKLVIIDSVGYWVPANLTQYNPFAFEIRVNGATSATAGYDNIVGKNNLLNAIYAVSNATGESAVLDIVLKVTLFVDGAIQSPITSSFKIVMVDLPDVSSTIGSRAYYGNEVLALSESASTNYRVSSFGETTLGQTNKNGLNLSHNDLVFEYVFDTISGESSQYINKFIFENDGMKFLAGTGYTVYGDGQYIKFAPVVGDDVTVNVKIVYRGIEFVINFVVDEDRVDNVSFTSAEKTGIINGSSVDANNLFVTAGKIEWASGLVDENVTFDVNGTPSIHAGSIALNVSSTIGGTALQNATSYVGVGGDKRIYNPFASGIALNIVYSNTATSGAGTVEIAQNVTFVSDYVTDIVAGGAKDNYLTSVNAVGLIDKVDINGMIITFASGKTYTIAGSGIVNGLVAQSYVSVGTTKMWGVAVYYGSEITTDVGVVKVELNKFEVGDARLDVLTYTLPSANGNVVHEFSFVTTGSNGNTFVVDNTVAYHLATVQSIIITGTPSATFMGGQTIDMSKMTGITVLVAFGDGTRSYTTTPVSLDMLQFVNGTGYTVIDGGAAITFGAVEGDDPSKTIGIVITLGGKTATCNVTVYKLMISAITSFIKPANFTVTSSGRDVSSDDALDGGSFVAIKTDGSMERLYFADTYNRSIFIVSASAVINRELVAGWDSYKMSTIYANTDYYFVYSDGTSLAVSGVVRF